MKSYEIFFVTENGQKRIKMDFTIKIDKVEKKTISELGYPKLLFKLNNKGKPCIAYRFPNTLQIERTLL